MLRIDRQKGGGGAGRGGGDKDKKKKKNDRGKSTSSASAVVVAAPKFSGFRAEIARTLRAFSRGPLVSVKVEEPEQGRVDRLLRGGASSPLVGPLRARVWWWSAKLPFRPPAFDAAASILADSPASMEDWTGVVWTLLARAGTVVRASELFGRLSATQSSFSRPISLARTVAEECHRRRSVADGENSRRRLLSVGESGAARS